MDSTWTVTIRALQEADLPALEWDGVYTKYRRVFRQAYEDMRSGLRLLFVALTDDLMVGQVFIQFNSSDGRYADGWQRAYLYSLRVRPDWQRQGIGSALIKAAETALRTRRFTVAVIAVRKDNPEALRLYQRLGYQIFAEDPGQWDYLDAEGVVQHVEEPSWVLEKTLGD